MQVKAIEMGYHNHVRVKPGTVFNMDDSIALAKKDEAGKPVLPKWVIPANATAKQKKPLHLPGTKVVAQKKSSGKPMPIADAGDDSEATGDADVI